MTQKQPELNNKVKIFIAFYQQFTQLKRNGLERSIVSLNKTDSNKEQIETFEQLLLPGRVEQRSAMVMIRLPSRTISQIRNLSPGSTTRSRNPKPTVNATNWGARMNCTAENKIFF
jgi:hypothetical protein